MNGEVTRLTCLFCLVCPFNHWEISGTYCLMSRAFVCGPTEVQNCAFLVSSATEHFAVETRLSQLVVSEQFMINFQAMIIITKSFPV